MPKDNKSKTQDNQLDDKKNRSLQRVVSNLIGQLNMNMYGTDRKGAE